MDRKNVLCFGDSNTWGYMPGGIGRYDYKTRWTGILQEKLGADYYVIEEGLCGRTTAWEDPIEGYKSGVAQLIPILLSHSPLDLVIIMLGTNDLKLRFSLSPQDIALGIETLVKIIQQPLDWYYRVPEILVVCPPPLAGIEESPISQMFTGAGEKSRKLAGEISAVMLERGIRCFNSGEHVVSSTVDGIHLDEKSHAVLGQAMCTEVLKFFE